MWKANSIFLSLLLMSIFPKFTFQLLLVPKMFPVWQIKANNFLPLSSCDNYLSCVSTQIYQRLESNQCDFSVILGSLKTSPSHSECSPCILNSIFKLDHPETISSKVHVNFEQHEVSFSSIYRLRYSRFCRVIFAQHGKISTLKDSYDQFTDSDVFESFYILYNYHKELSKQSTQQNSAIFQKLRYVLFLSCEFDENLKVDNVVLYQESKCPDLSKYHSIGICIPW